MVEPILEVRQHTLRLAELADELAQERRARDAAMFEAYAAGTRITDIAHAADVTPARVSVILGHPRGKPGRPRLQDRITLAD